MDECARIIIGGDPEAVPAGERPPGTVRRPCSKCERGVLLAPSSREFEGQGAVVFCIPCGIVEAVLTSVTVGAEVTFPSGQREELARLGIDEDQARALRARFAKMVGAKLVDEE